MSGVDHLCDPLPKVPTERLAEHRLSPCFPGDLLLSAEWIAAAFGSHVIWRGARIRIIPQVITPEVNLSDVSDERYDTPPGSTRVVNHDANR